MPADINYWPLLGVAAIVIGFALRRNPVLVVVIAGLVSGIAAGLPIPKLLTLLGRSFVENRLLLLFVLTLPVIGLLERHGLRERARRWIASFRRLRMFHILISYLGLRQLFSMFGLTHVAGHAQTVRPLIAPMSEATAERELGSLTGDQRARIRANAAATDNIGLFFGEDVFIAFSAVLLIQAFFASNAIALEPLEIARWAIPTAIAAFVIHSGRLWLLQRRLLRERSARMAQEASSAAD
ncbi:MAG: DUF969 family protein [Dokdonella sp.]